MLMARFGSVYSKMRSCAMKNMCFRQQTWPAIRLYSFYSTEYVFAGAMCARELYIGRRRRVPLTLMRNAAQRRVDERRTSLDGL